MFCQVVTSHDTPEPLSSGPYRETGRDVTTEGGELRGFLLCGVLSAPDEAANHDAVADKKSVCPSNQPDAVSSVFVSDWNSQGYQVEKGPLMTDSQPSGTLGISRERIERHPPFQPWANYGILRINFLAGTP